MRETDNKTSLRTTVLSYAILSFVCVNFTVVYLLLRSLEVDENYDIAIEKQVISVEFMSQISRGIVLHNAQNYEAAVRICEQIQTNGLEPVQLHKIFLLKAICYRSAGLWSVAMSNIDLSLRYHKSSFAYLIKGILQEHRGEIAAAIESYQSAIQIQSTYYVAYEKIGDLYLRKGDYKRASHYYHARGAYKEKDLPSFGNLKVALIYFQQRKYEEALVKVGGYLQQVSQFIPGYWITGFSHDQLGNREIARRDFRKGIQLAEEEKVLWQSKYYFAVFLAKNREYVEGEQVLKEILGTNLPQSQRKVSRRLLAYVISSKGNHAEGIRTMLSLLQEGDFSVEDLYYTGMMYYAHRQYEESSRIFRRLHNTTQVGRYALSAYLLLAVMQAKDGNFSTALQTLQEAKKKNGDIPEIRWMMGSLILRHNIREAKTLLSKMFQGEKSIESRKMLADFHTRSGNYSGAIPLYEGLVEEVDVRIAWKLYRNLAILYNKVGNLDKSLLMYTKSIGVVPNDVERAKILNNMSYVILVGQMDKKRSLQMLQEASNRSKRVPMIYYNLALFIKSSDWQEYAKYMDLALQGHKEVLDKRGRSLLYLEAGLYYRSKNQIEKSRKYFRMSLEYEPDVDASELELAGSHT